MDFRVTILLQALNKKTKPYCDLSDEQWNQCFEFAAEHGLDCLFFNYYSHFFTNTFKLTSIYKQWKKAVVQHIFWGKTSELYAQKVLKLLKERNIKYVVLKGIDLATYYDSPENRTMSDMDILVDVKDLEVIDSTFKEADYIHAIEDDTDKEKIYYPQVDGYFFEVHFGLFKKTLSDFTDEFTRIAFETAVRSEKLDMYVLEPTVSTAYMLIHMAKHLYGTGIGLKGLYDLARYVHPHSKDIDQARLVEYLKAFAMLKTGAYLLSCAQYYLKSAFMIEYEIDDEVRKNLFGLIVRSGDTGMREEYVIEQRYEDLVKTNKKQSQNQIRRLDFVFLPLGQMKKRYPQLNTLPWLLPVFWCFRVIRVLFKSRQNFVKWLGKDIDQQMLITHKDTLLFLKEE